jgi:hypothetical protein
MYNKKSTLLILFLAFSAEFVFGQNSDAIRFICRYRPDRPPHPTFAICLGHLAQPYEAGWLDSLKGSAILTDSNTYRWIKGYILRSSHAYRVKDVGRVDSYGTPMCPTSSPALEVKDSTGMDMFICSEDWRLFFETLRSELQQNQMDTVVINAFKNPPSWPVTPTTTVKLVRIN